MDTKRKIVKLCLLKHKIIGSYLPYSNYTDGDFCHFFDKLDRSEVQLKLFLLFEGWYSEQVDLIIDFIERFSKYFLENDEKGTYKNNLELINNNEKRIFKILVLFSSELKNEEIIQMRTNILLEFLNIYIKLMNESDILILVSFFNQIFTMIQEYVGLMIQFFLCVPDTEKDIILVRKYLNGQVAFTFQYCDYFVSDYLALFDKTFNNQIDVNNSVLNNREVLFNKLFEIITGKKIDYTSEDLNIDSSLKTKRLPSVNDKIIDKVIRAMPEIYSPMKLCYTYLTGEFSTDESIKLEGFNDLFSDNLNSYDDYENYI